MDAQSQNAERELHLISEHDERRLQLWEKGVTAAVLIWVFLLGCTQMNNYDIWYHLRTGQLIFERGSVPWLDWYTYTNWDKPWIELHWLFQLLVAGLYKLGGVKLLVLTKALCLALAVAIAWRASGQNLPTWAKTVCWIMPIICLAGRNMVKPGMLSLVFLAVWLWIASRAERKPSLVWWLPVLQIIWTNCHGLFVLGFVVGAAFAGDQIARFFARGRFGLHRLTGSLSGRRLVIAGILTAGASLVNPYVEEGAMFPLTLYQKVDVEAEYFNENQSTVLYVQRYGFSTIYLIAEVGLWAVTTVSFLWLARERRVDVLRVLLFAGFSYLALMAIRNMDIFGLVAGVVLCANCGEALLLRRQRRSSQQASSENVLVTESPVTNSSTLNRSVRTNQATIIVLIGLSLSVVTNVWHDLSGLKEVFGLDQRKARFIHGAAQFAGQPGFPKGAFVSNYGQAAVYFFHNAPQRRVFMDGRLEVVSPATELRFETVLISMAFSDPFWEQLVRTPPGNLPVVILDTADSSRAIVGMFSTPGWRLVYADTVAAVFVDERTANQLGLASVDPKLLLLPHERSR